jgi:hypothetical protein
MAVLQVVLVDLMTSFVESDFKGHFFRGVDVAIP